MVTSIQTAEHYTWGQQCDGWHLLKTDTLSVIQERMPPGTTESLHFHSNAQQLFYILSGVASFSLEGQTYSLYANESIHVLPGQVHQISNLGKEELHFLVISEPKAHGDRTNVL